MQNFPFLNVCKTLRFILHVFRNGEALPLKSRGENSKDRTAPPSLSPFFQRGGPKCCFNVGWWPQGTMKYSTKSVITLSTFCGYPYTVFVTLTTTSS